MVFDRCVLRGIVPVSPMQAVSVPKGLAVTKRSVPQDDALKAVRTHTDVPFAPFALLCLYAGLRRGEALALRQEDIDRKAGVIHVTRALEYIGNQPEIKTPKTSSGVRDVPIPSFCRISRRGRATCSRWKTEDRSQRFLSATPGRSTVNQSAMRSPPTSSGTDTPHSFTKQAFRCWPLRNCWAMQTPALL